MSRMIEISGMFLNNSVYATASTLSGHSPLRRSSATTSPSTVAPANPAPANSSVFSSACQRSAVWSPQWTWKKAWNMTLDARRLPALRAVDALARGGDPRARLEELCRIALVLGDDLLHLAVLVHLVDLRRDRGLQLGLLARDVPGDLVLAEPGEVGVRLDVGVGRRCRQVLDLHAQLGALLLGLDEQERVDHR